MVATPPKTNAGLTSPSASSAATLLVPVLKGNSSFPDKSPSSGSPSFDQQSTEVSSSGNSLRVASLRQLSNNFAQFNNLQSPLRSRKPLTKKDAVLINKWRFLKLKEYRDRNIEAENDAFDRYMQNVSLLEEVFAVSSTLEEPKKYASPVSNPDHNSENNDEMISNPDPSSEQNNEMISRLKLKLRLDRDRTENVRERVQYIVDQGLRKLKNLDTRDTIYDLSDEAELIKRPKKAKYSRAERAVALRDLSDKLSKARNEEDLKSCREMKAQLFDTRKGASGGETGDIETLKQQDASTDESHEHQSGYSPPKWFSTITIDQDALNLIDARFSSLEEIEDL